MSLFTERELFLKPDDKKYCGPYDDMEEYQTKMRQLERDNQTDLSALEVNDEEINIISEKEQTQILDNDKIKMLTTKEIRELFPV